MPRRVRLVVVVCLSPILAGLGNLGFQVIANGEVGSWAAVALTMVAVALVTCWTEWSALVDLWQQDC